MNKTSNYYRHLKKWRRNKLLIRLCQCGLLVLFFLLWELFSATGVISSFLFSKPSKVVSLFFNYMDNGEIFVHIWTSLKETLFGLIIGTLAGIVIAIILYFNNNIAKVLDPFLVVANALPKTALAPIILVWFGAGLRGIVMVAIITSIVITILSCYTYFKGVSEEKIKMFKTFKASRRQILLKLILPSNIANLISVVKINIGMAWIGVIVGEFLVASKGLGYLIDYGSDTFRLDLVMMGILILAILAWLMYSIVNQVEKYFRRKY